MNIVVSLFANIPIYEQIQNQVHELVLSRKLKPGEQLPSIRQLAKELKISVITVKRAYEELEREKIVVTIPGKGCFINEIDFARIKANIVNQLEVKLSDIVQLAKANALSKNEVIEIINYLYEEKKHV